MDAVRATEVKVEGGKDGETQPMPLFPDISIGDAPI